MFSIRTNTHVTCNNPCDGSISHHKEHQQRQNLGIFRYLNFQPASAKPTTKVAQADDVVTLIVHRFGEQRMMGF